MVENNQEMKICLVVKSSMKSFHMNFIFQTTEESSFIFSDNRKFWMSINSVLVAGLYSIYFFLELIL